MTTLVRVARMAKWVDTAVVRRASAHADHRVSGRQRLVLAAAAAIEQHGVDAGTGQIADVAGVQRPHVYRHFQSKQDLADEVARYAASQLLARVRPRMVSSGTPERIIHGVVAEAVTWAEENPNLYRFIAARQQTKATQSTQLGGTRFLGEVVAALTAYLRAREIEQEPPGGVLAGLMGMVDASIIWWLDHRDEAATELVDRLSRQVWLVLKSLAVDLGVPITDDTVLALSAAPSPQ